jgi:hypothetical protein
MQSVANSGGGIGAGGRNLPHQARIEVQRLQGIAPHHMPAASDTDCIFAAGMQSSLLSHDDRPKRPQGRRQGAALAGPACEIRRPINSNRD